MRLRPIRYKDYTWPHNPETFVMENRKQVVVHKIPFGKSVLQDLGTTYCVYSGEGVFAGEKAYEEFRELEAVFHQGGVGVLVHPVWGAKRAYFVSLAVTEEPQPDYVRYRFVFWEDWAGYTGELKTVPVETAAAEEGKSVVAEEKRTHVVRSGDTLWGIAGEYGVTLQALVAANPQIKNPNLIYPGDEVVLP